MIIFVLFAVTYGCLVISSISNLYPSQNETYELDMSKLFEGYNLTYRCRQGENEEDCSTGIVVENVLNQEEIYKQSDANEVNYVTKSASNLYNIFITLTKQSTVNKYYYNQTNNTLILDEVQPISESLRCFNSFFHITDILLDCYNGSSLQFKYFNQTTMNGTFNQPAIPQSTKVISTVNVIIYAQFYTNYSLLTLFSITNGEVRNQSTFPFYTFTDFTLTLDNQLIVLNQTLNLWVVDIKFSSIQSISLSTAANILLLAIRYYYSLQNQVHNQFLFVVTDKPYYNIQQYLFQDNSKITPIIIYEAFQTFALDPNYSISIEISDEFLIIQQYAQQNYFYKGWAQSNESLFENSMKHQILSENRTESYLLLNRITNLLIKFDSKITAFHLTTPKLKITNPLLQNSSFEIAATDVSGDEIRFCKKAFNYTLLAQNDLNIYQTFTDDEINVFALQGLNRTVELNQFYSGPLMQVTLSSNNSSPYQGDSKFNYATTNLSLQNIELTKIYFIQQTNILFYVWGNSESLFLSFCTSVQEQNYYCNQNSQQISLSTSAITNIEIGQLYQDKGNSMLIAINQGVQLIQVYQIQYQPEDQLVVDFEVDSMFNYSCLTCSIAQFFLMFNKLIVFYDNEIIVQLLTNTSKSFIINNNTINDELRNISNYFTGISEINFQPVNLSVNMEYYASVLFVNNLDCFMIIQLCPSSNFELDYCYTILSINQVSFEIYQLNIIRSNLIVSYLVGEMVQFEVYDISDLSHPKFVKYLPGCQLQPNWILQSDNIFLYVLTSNQSINAYNILMPYHSVLYFSFPFNGSYLSVSNTRFFSILSYKSDLYQLQPLSPVVILGQIFEINSSLIKMPYHVTVYNQWSTVSNLIKVELLNTYTDITLNQTQFDLNNNKTLNFKYYSSAKRPVTKQLNMTNVAFGQVLNYSIEIWNTSSGVTEKNRQIAQITNQLTPDNATFSNNIVNVTHIVSWNNSFIVQNSSGLYILYPLRNGDLLVSYSTLNFTKCASLSVSENNILNSICGDEDTQHSLFFSMNNNSATLLNYQALPDYFYHIAKAYLYGQQWLFILGSQSSITKVNRLFVYDVTASDCTLIPHKINCDNGLTDFNISTLFNQTDLNITVIKVVVLYTCQAQYTTSLRYLGFTITNGDLKFHQFSNVVQYFHSYSQYPGTQFLQIMTLRIQMDQLLLLLTTNNIANFIFLMNFNPLQQKSELLQFQDLVQTIPPYGSFLQAPKAVNQGSYLLLLFYTLDRQIKQSVYAIYNMSLQYYRYHRSEPLLMLAGYNQTLFNLSLQQFAIVPNNSGAYLMEIYPTVNNGSRSIRVDNIIFSNLTYFIGKPNEQWENCSFYLLAENSFCSQSILMDLTPPKDSKYIWAWSLLALTVVICSVLVVLFFKKISNPELEPEREEPRYQEIEM